MSERRGPILIEDEAVEARPSPAEVPPVTDDGEIPQPEAMRTIAALTARKSSALGRWFWRLLGAVVLFFLSVSTWAAIESMLARSEILGLIAMGLVGLFALVVLAVILRELTALSRLKAVAVLQKDATQALADEDLASARKVADGMERLYHGRPELDLHRQSFADRREDQFDADALLELAETELLVPLDAAARIEIEAAARQVATVTALVPLALADVLAALLSNVRMIRRIAEIYGGRAGTLGAWRLLRAVFGHLVATGAVAVGDDLLGSVAGGSVLSRVSRRFGEGIVNGALTARVGVAAMEVCRPLPFRRSTRPQVHALVARALGGLVPKMGRDGDAKD
ncbi:YcjF family protein [Palleronia caenipelagi]|uniref:TIGR01620 family protein n=1 Tax=Palleronia caenipelagi TaxID=2489174 RepID=A0A547PXR8_9RHOB|nr:TIGR01620 family protein [Palleronia caenipelagi]TRD18950.1 TIGR01620 family protein [Palleronia caenipelagi]